MKLQEFSDTFDTLLNSYNSQAQFGEGASKKEIVLDEYEKSVLLTQAQDIIVKTYFDNRLNPQAQGFDESERRQVDFSALIKNTELKPLGSTDDVITQSTTIKVRYVTGEGHAYVLEEYTFDLEAQITSEEPVTIKRVIPTIAHTNDFITSVGLDTSQIIYGGLDTHNYAIVDEGSDSPQLTVFIRVTLEDREGTGDPTSSSAQIFSFTSASTRYAELRNILESYGISMNITSDFPMPFYDGYGNDENHYGEKMTFYWKSLGYIAGNLFNYTDEQKESFDSRGIIYELPSDVLFVLNEALVFNDGTRLVVKPLAYREYDREMSKAYAQPLKKQAWRLFNNISTGYDIYSEIIMNENLAKKFKVDNGPISYVYKIRYVKRPQPIILVDLPNNLDIDGKTEATECEINPILHVDIINKAVEIAITTRGGRPAEATT